jgi:hypothetical protein
MPCLLIVDLHEWRNDSSTVSNIDSVKLKSPCGYGLSAGRREDPIDLHFSMLLKGLYASKA